MLPVVNDERRISHGRKKNIINVNHNVISRSKLFIGGRGEDKKIYGGGEKHLDIFRGGVVDKRRS